MRPFVPAAAALLAVAVPSSAPAQVVLSTAVPDYRSGGFPPYLGGSAPIDGFSTLNVPLGVYPGYVTGFGPFPTYYHPTYYRYGYGYGVRPYYSAGYRSYRGYGGRWRWRR